MTDAIFFALSDPLRREMLTRLVRRGPQTTLNLIKGLGGTRQGVSKHLAVLEASGLVRSTRHGREIHREVDLATLRGTCAWVSKLEFEWDSRLAGLADQYRLDE